MRDPCREAVTLLDAPVGPNNSGTTRISYLTIFHHLPPNVRLSFFALVAVIPSANAEHIATQQACQRTLLLPENSHPGTDSRNIDRGRQLRQVSLCVTNISHNFDTSNLVTQCPLPSLVDATHATYVAYVALEAYLGRRRYA
jgi:hypothetical protein